VSGADHWEKQAQRWAAWAREPGHDSYWTESGPPFLDLVPALAERHSISAAAKAASHAI
jgi:hypothetical protein